MDQPKQKENPFLNIALNVIIPSVIMMKLSNDKYLGQVWGLIIALLFPIAYGIFDFIKSKKLNFFSLLGLFSVLMTGGIGLLSLDRKWMIVKETAIPFVMGVAVLISRWTKFSFVPAFLGQILDLEKIETAFTQKDKIQKFHDLMISSSYLLGSTFFVSAILNYVLAEKILVGQPGSIEFNESLGKMTALSFPVITLPMMIMTGVIFMLIFRSIKKVTSLELEEIFKQH